ncbi:MAG: HXXEE domain-containing protein [Flavobacteriaceae bacterium]|nr:HXXEE domain-containing protein [Flavobacteriaceae bacterium]NNK72996.1 HXXEE domain-containing protein [Flavobacteriaceae bacterium]
MVIALVSILALWFVSRSIGLVLVFVPGIIISFIFCQLSFDKRVPDPKSVLPLYLFALGVQFLHFTEEYLTGFVIELPALFNQPPYPTDIWLVFNMVAYFIFILGGITLFWRSGSFLIIPVFFILFGIMFNGLAHLGTSLYVGGYFPGLYTAMIYLVLGPLLIGRLLNSRKHVPGKG